MKNLIAFLFVIVSSSAGLQSMEDAEQKSINKKRKHSVAEDISEKQAVRFKKIRETVGWDSLPPESKQHILYFVATGGKPTDALKNLKRAGLANKECHELTEDKPFLKSLAATWLSKNPQNSTNIFIAASGAHQIDFFDAFRQASIDIDQPNLANVRALDVAIENGHDDFIKILLDEGAEINWTNLLFVNGRPDISKMLVSQGCLDIPTILPGQKKSSLLYDIIYGRLKRVKALLKKGTNVNLRDQHGVTGLMYASINGDKEMADLLINNGADVNAQLPSGIRALMFAIQANSFDIVKLLLDNKASVDFLDGSSFAPLTLAAQRGHSEIVKLLIENNVDVNLQEGYHCFNMGCEEWS